MGTFIAKTKHDNQHWYKLRDGINYTDYESIDLHDAMIYDPNNQMGNQWFKLSDFNKNKAYIPMLSEIIDAANLMSIDRNLYSQISFIAYYCHGKFYLQNVKKGDYLSKKWFSIDEIIKYNEESDIIYLKKTPDCIYDLNTHSLYFMHISKAYSVFKDIRNDYKVATQEEVDKFLSSDIIMLHGFETSKVGIANRKRITSLLGAFNNYSNEEKNTLKNYIRDMVNKKIDYEDGKFIIASDNQLRLLLYGLMQRFFIPPLSGDPQVATNATKIENIL